MKTLLALLLLTNSAWADAITLPTLPSAFWYQQQSLKLSDLQSDLELATLVRDYNLGNIQKMLLLKKGNNNAYETLMSQKDKFLTHDPFQLNEPLSPKSSLVLNLPKETVLSFVDDPTSSVRVEGKTNPINRKQMAKCLTQLLNDEYISNNLEPVIGETHHWSKEFLASYAKDFGIVAKVDDLLVALAIGRSSQFMFAGPEEQFIKVILEAPMKSLSFHDVFSLSYRLNNGNIYLTLLTIENVFSRNWWKSNRDYSPVFMRLKPMAQAYAHRTSDYGVWYHFLGTMLYGVARDNTAAWLVSKVERMGSHWSSQGADQTQKDFANSMGALVGADLKKIVKNKSYMIRSNDDACTSEPYLNKSEDFRDRLPLKSDSNFKIEIQNTSDGLSVLKLFNKGPEIKSCELEVMTDQGDGFSADAKLIYKDVTIDSAQNKKWLLPMGGVKRVRLFFTNCQ